MISFLIFVLIVGFIAFLINQLNFIEPIFRQIIIGILCLVVIIQLLNVLGINTGLHFYR